MRLASARPTTQGERIFQLEEARKNDGARLDSMETKVNEMHEILISVRALGRAIRFVATWLGGPSALAAGALYLWRALH